MLVVGFALAPVATEIWHLYLFYGILCGFGTGFCYNLWTSSVFAFFPDRTGLASGILLMGFGMGSLVLGSAATAVIYSPIGWRGTFYVLALLVVILAFLSAPFLKRPSVDETDAKTEKRSESLLLEDAKGLTGVQMLKTGSFWLYTLWKVLVMGASAAIIAQAVPLMSSLDASIVFATAVAGALSVGNGLGRPIIGTIYDKAGRNFTLIALAVSAVIVGVFLVAGYMASNLLITAAGMFLQGIIYGGYATVNTTFVRTVYGQRHVATNLGISSFTLMPFNAIFPVLAGFAFAWFGDYTTALMTLPILAAISLVSAILVVRVLNKECPHA